MHHMEISPEPRIGLKYNISEKFRIKAASGVYSQNLISANSDRDVVNLFMDFLLDPTIYKILSSWIMKTVARKHSLQSYAQFEFEVDLAKRLTLNVGLL